MDEYKICMYLCFVSGKDPDSFYPGEDKLWLEILLDEYHGDHLEYTVDCNGIELPRSLLKLSRRSREEYINAIEDEIVEHVAELLVRNGVEEYGFDGILDIDWLDINNAEGIRFDDQDCADILERLEW